MFVFVSGRSVEKKWYCKFEDVVSYIDFQQDDETYMKLIHVS